MLATSNLNLVALKEDIRIRQLGNDPNLTIPNSKLYECFWVLIQETIEFLEASCSSNSLKGNLFTTEKTTPDKPRTSRPPFHPRFNNLSTPFNDRPRKCRLKYCIDKGESEHALFACPYITGAKVIPFGLNQMLTESQICKRCGQSAPRCDGSCDGSFLFKGNTKS